MQAQISLLIDYAHEPESLTLFLQTLQSWKKLGYFDLLVHVLSSDGVGRDDWKKPIMGNLSYKYADFTILTTDNYGKGDNPQAILALLGKNFLHKDEQLTQEWLDKIQNYNLEKNLENSQKTSDILVNNFKINENQNQNETENQMKSKPKVKFLLEINRKKALAKALKVGLFLAQNYEILNFDETSEIKSLSKKPPKNIEMGIKIENESLKKNENLGADLELNLKKVRLESEILSQILENDYKENGQLEKLENTKKNLVFENQFLENSISETLEKTKNSDTINKQNIEQNKKTGKKVKVLIFSTGVGCEPFLSQPDGNLAWNEKKIWQNLWQEFISVETFNQKLEQKIQK